MGGVNSGHVHGEGCSTCPIWKDWEAHKIQTKNIESKVVDVHTALGRLLRDTGHLHKLNKLDNLDILVKAVAGMNRDSEKTAYLVAKILGFVILGLVFTLVALLTGAHLEFIKLH